MGTHASQIFPHKTMSSPTRQLRNRATASSPTSRASSLLTTSLHHAGITKSTKALHPFPSSNTRAAVVASTRSPTVGNYLAAEAARAASMPKPQWIVEQGRTMDWHEGQIPTAYGFKREVLHETGRAPLKGVSGVQIQMVVETDRVLLRGWPQADKEEPVIVSFDAFIAGDRREQLVQSFGKDAYIATYKVVKKALAAL
ncbi:hypothetical protein BC830DRAFT_1159144 [Chytriomyces sp. MP71]|nr:hypothetical protein BC830DRAFT_1159144 [Chytriomyces sp. MP71]